MESGLISYEHWLSNRFYMVNIRSTADDDLSPRNVVVQFTNNNIVPIDVLIFAVYLEKFSIDVVTGAIVS